MMTDSNLLADLITSDLLKATESQNGLKEENMHTLHKSRMPYVSYSQEHIYNVNKYLTRLIANNFLDNLAS